MLERDRKLGRSRYTSPTVEEFLASADPTGTLVKQPRAGAGRAREVEPDATSHTAPMIRARRRAK